MTTLADYLFDGALLLGSHACLNHSYWHSLRHNMAGVIEGAFHRVAGAWPGTRGLLLEKGDASITNLVFNPSVETNVTGYDPVDDDGGTTTLLAQSSDAARYGNYSLKVTPDTYAYAGVDYDIVLNTILDYTVSVWFKGSEGQPYFLALYDGAANRILTTFTATGEWQRIHGHGATADQPNCTLRLLKNNDANTDPFYLDGVQIEAHTYLTSYCDGDQGHDYSWNGTEHAGTSKRVTSYVDLADHVAIFEAQDKLTIRVVLQAPLDADDANWPESSYNYVYHIRNATEYIVLYYDPSDDKFKAALTDGTDSCSLVAGAAHTFKAGDWIDLTLTIDYNATGAGSYKLYYNGTEVDSKTTSDIAAITGVTDWTLGSSFAGAYQGGWAIAEYAVWQEVITTVSELAELRCPLVDVYGTHLPYRPTWREENVRDGYDVVIPDNGVYWAWAVKKNAGDSDPVYGAYTLAGIQGQVAEEGLVIVEWCDGGPKTICDFKWDDGSIAWNFDPGALGTDVTISSAKDLTIKTTSSNDIVIQATGSGGDTKIEAARRMHVHGKKLQITANTTYDWGTMTNGDLVIKADDGILISNYAGDQDEDIIVSSGQHVIINVGAPDPPSSAADYVAVNAQLRLYNVYGNPLSPQTGAIWYNTATGDLWFKGPTYYYKIDMTQQ